MKPSHVSKRTYPKWVSQMGTGTFWDIVTPSYVER